MTGLEVTRTPEIIGSEIRLYYEAGRRITMLCGIEIGRRLAEAKEMLQHGEWLPWLERETPFSERHAQNYMRIFREYGEAQQGLFGPETNAKYIADLPISKALLLLSVPESERDEFAETVDADKLSAEELKAAIKERDEAREKARKWEETAGSYASQANDLQNDLADARKQIKELESRPQTVAVEKDEQAIQEAAAAAEEKARAEAAKQIEDLQKKLEKAEKAKEKAEKSGAGAAEQIAAAQAEAAKAREELETAQKKLLAADKDVAELGVFIRQLQVDLNEIQSRIRKIRERDAAMADKLQAVFQGILSPHVEARE